jgi:hypothetical protein
LDDLVEFAEGYLEERQPFRLQLGEGKVETNHQLISDQTSQDLLFYEIEVRGKWSENRVSGPFAL